MSYQAYLSDSGLLHGIAAFLQSQGLHANSLLVETGFTEEELKGSGVPVHSVRIATLLERASATLGNPLLGLEYARVRDFGEAYGLIAALARTRRIYRTSLETFINYTPLVDQSARWKLFSSGNTVQATRKNLLPSEIACLQWRLLEMGNAYLACRERLGNTWQPTAITFAMKEPAKAVAIRNFFATTVQFDAESDAICYQEELLTQHTPHRADSSQEALILTRLNQIESNTDRDIRDLVKSLISVSLSDGGYSKTRIASILGIGPHTLLRKLKEKNSSYSELLLETRMELAASYLATSALSLSKVSDFLGYRCLNSFSRAFKSWYGVEPSRWPGGARKSVASAAACSADRDGAGCQSR